MIAQKVKEDTTARSVHFLLKRNLYQFHDHSILAKGLFYKKGHIIQNWKFRSYVVNDFSADREDHLNRDAQLRYYKPQNAQNFHKERHETDQKTIKLRTIAFELGDSTNIAKCGTVYPQTAFALNVIFEDEGGTKLMYELVFNAKCEAEEFIRGMCSGARFTRGVKDFLKKANMNIRNVLGTPRLGFTPSYQTSLLCIKCAPVCDYPDCCGWGSFCSCCCCENYTQGGMLCEELNVHDNGRMNLASVFYTCCQVEQQWCCIDTRCALPTDNDVPLEISCCGINFFGDSPRSMRLKDTELQTLI